MSSCDSNIIAWLVPTARGTSADRTTNLHANAHLTVPVSSIPDPVPSSSPSSTSPQAASPNFLATTSPNTPRKAIALRFNSPVKRPGQFTIGTNPAACDVVLPPTPGTKCSPQHCSVGFDAEGRITLTDFSDRGSSVWFGWECSGDQTDHTWVLSDGPPAQTASTAASDEPATPAGRIIIDIQSIRFRLILNDHSANWLLYSDKVKDFCKQPSWAINLTPGWDRMSVKPVAPLFTQVPLFQHIFVKSPEEDLGAWEDEFAVGGLGQTTGAIDGGMYLWNMARPWEPLVRAAA